MSSDGKPLWGFRKIFFLLGVAALGIAYLLLTSWLNPTENFRRVNPPGSTNYIVHVSLIPVLIALGAAELWFWRQLRAGRLTPTNWRIGIGLLLPGLILFPLGPLCMLNWCTKLCRDLFRSAPSLS